MAPQYTWSVLVPASDLHLDKMKYRITIPILGPCCRLSACSVKTRLLDGVLRVRHTGRQGCVTEAVIELPEDVGSQYTVVDMLNTLDIAVEHRLHSRWWDGVVALCIAADEGDCVVWDEAWRTLQRVALEMRAASVRERTKALVETTPLPADVATTIAERACLAEDGWMLGGAMFPLHFAHAAMDCDEPAPGALGRLEQLLTRGGLTRDGMVEACESGFARNRRGPDWVEHIGEATVHEAVVRCTGMSVGELLTGAYNFVCGPLCLPNTVEERAAIKARVHADVR